MPNIPFNLQSLFMTPTNEDKFLQVNKGLKNKAGGSDDLHSFIIKLAAPYISKPLVHIINSAMKNGTCPTSFKSAVVYPVFKNGSKKLADNYRPIALISNLAKVFERIIHGRISKFAVKHKLLSARQFGFLKKKGTKDPIALLSKFLYGNLAESNPTIVIFLDYSKAFDTVDHKILLSKFHNMGIRGVCLDLIESYLHGRKQVVKVNGKKSETAEINVGVPQGSILGPLLFILYINDLLVALEELIAYADDTAVVLSGVTWYETALLLKIKLQ